MVSRRAPPVMQLRAAREPRIAGIFDVRASARCRRDFVLETCSELHTTLLPSGPVNFAVRRHMAAVSTGSGADDSQSHAS